MNTRESSVEGVSMQVLRETLSSIRHRESNAGGRDVPSTSVEDELDVVGRDLGHDVQRELRAREDEAEADKIRRKIGIRTSLEIGEEAMANQQEVALTAEEGGQLETLPRQIFEEEAAEGGQEEAISRFSADVLLSIEKNKDKLPPAVLKTLDFCKRFEPEIEVYLSKSLANLSEQEYAQQLLGVFEQVKSYIPEEYYNEAVSQILNQPPGEQKVSRLKKLASVGIDFIPLVGPTKMLVETKTGRTLDGRKLEGWKRTLHGIEGGAFLLLDAVGVGVPFTKAVKGSEVGAKLFTRSAAIARKAGMGREIYGPIFRTGKLIAENPALTRLVDKTFDQIVMQRKLRLADAMAKDIQT